MNDAVDNFSAGPSLAHVVRSDAEAIAIAHELAAEFSREASERDRDRRLPGPELDRFSRSGLWGMTVPREYGGAGVSYVTVCAVIKIISAADPSIGQVPQNHLGVVDALRTVGTEAQKRFWFGEVLAGRRFGNAFSERGSKHAGQFDTTIRPDADGFVLNGQKFYSTGALFADYVPVAASDEQGRPNLAIVARDAPGLQVIDDWSSFGQRTTASGTVTLDHVPVAADAVFPAYLAYEHPSANGPVAQIIQAAVDAGIASAAIAETIRFVRTLSRPWIDSGQDHAHEDVFTISQIGDLQVRMHAAEAILDRAALATDVAVVNPTDETVAEASIAVAESKVLTTEIAILATNKLFELAGTRSTLGQYNLDRHWRNARTHTLHDPVRWKFHAVGNYLLNGVKPPRHAWL